MTPRQVNINGRAGERAGATPDRILFQRGESLTRSVPARQNGHVGLHTDTAQRNRLVQQLYGKFRKRCLTGIIKKIIYLSRAF